MSDAIARMRKHFLIGEDEPVGIVACVGKDVEVDTSRGNRDIIVTANTADVDLDEEIVLPGGADTGYFLANRKVVVDHMYDMASCVGHVRALNPVKVGGETTAWKTRIGMYDLPIADDILKIARATGIGVSIGFNPTAYGPPSDDEVAKYAGKGSFKSIVRQWKWLELSFTAFPCNVACQSGAVIEDDSKQIQLDELVTKGVIRAESATALGMVEDAITKAAPSNSTRFIVTDGLLVKVTQPA